MGDTPIIRVLAFFLYLIIDVDLDCQMYHCQMFGRAHLITWL